MTDDDRQGSAVQRPAFIDPHTDVVECYGCRYNIAVENVAGSVDVSPDDEYYPDMKPLCPRCNEE